MSSMGGMMSKKGDSMKSKEEGKEGETDADKKESAKPENKE